MTVARSVARAVASPVARAVGAGIGGGVTLEQLVAESISFWALQDDAASTAVVESSGNGSNATASVNTSTLATTGPNSRYPKAHLFTGTQYTVTAGGLFASLPVFTVACWLKMTSGKSAYPITCWSGVNANKKFILQSSTTAALQFFTYTSSQVGGTTQAGVGTSWNHIAAVYDGAQMRTYVNGVLSGTTYAQTGGLNASSTPVTIGGIFEAGTGETAVAAVGCWGRVLTLPEIVTLGS